MKDLIQYLDDVTSASTVDEVWKLHATRMGHYGFDRLLYGFTRYSGTSNFGDPSDWIVLSTQTPEYMQYYFGDGHFKNAPMLRWASENSGACSWRIVEDLERTGALTEGELKMLEFNRSMGVTAGYTISFRSVSARTKGAIALTARSSMSQDQVEEIWSEHGCAIHMMNNVMHLKLLTLPHSGERRLTRRQREVLQWIGDGKSVQDTALLLGLTPATVEKHLRLAREALGVETTPQAVMKATLSNQMFVEDSGETV